MECKVFERRLFPSVGRFLLLATAILALAMLPLGCNEETAGPDGDGDDGGDDGGGGSVIRHPQDFLPPGTSGMPKDGEAEVATDVPGLTGIVNGGYTVYTSNGFREMVSQLYSGTVGGAAATITVWIFDLTTHENAAALHTDLLATGTWEEVGEVGVQDHQQASLLGYTRLFRRDEFSAQLEITANSEDAKNLVLLFAQHIDQEIAR